MPVTDFPAAGTVLAVEAGRLVFAPVNTTYRLHLHCAAADPGLVGKCVRGLIRLAARKLMTVSSGGNFIAPIQGPPRIVQGRVLYLDQRQMVLRAGTHIVVDLPAEDFALDLTRGPLAEGTLVNVAAAHAASFEPASPA